MTDSTPEPEQDRPAEPDHVSDPSLDEGASSDWAGEGGATPDGPATETDED